jgi:hypothetical protein
VVAAVTPELLAHARDELAKKTLADINRETAMLWGARALVALARYRETGIASWLSDATEYQHEAVEHAALSGDVKLVNYLHEVFR